MTHANHRTDEHDASKGNTPGIPPNEEEAIDKALQAEDEADEAEAEEVVASDDERHDGDEAE